MDRIAREVAPAVRLTRGWNSVERELHHGPQFVREVVPRAEQGAPAAALACELIRARTAAAAAG
jgi:hypothetical protein